MLSVFLNFYKKNNILIFPVVWIQVFMHSVRLFDLEEDIEKKGDVDWLFLVAVNFLVSIFYFHIALNYFEITWKRLAIMPFALGLTLYSALYGIHKFLAMYDASIDY